MESVVKSKFSPHSRAVRPEELLVRMAKEPSMPFGLFMCLCSPEVQAVLRDVLPHGYSLFAQPLFCFFDFPPQRFVTQEGVLYVENTNAYVCDAVLRNNKRLINQINAYFGGDVVKKIEFVSPTQLRGLTYWRH